jgi:hypothetical protein
MKGETVSRIERHENRIALQTFEVWKLELARLQRCFKHLPVYEVKMSYSRIIYKIISHFFVENDVYLDYNLKASLKII